MAAQILFCASRHMRSNFWRICESALPSSGRQSESGTLSTGLCESHPSSEAACFVLAPTAAERPTRELTSTPPRSRGDGPGIGGGRAEGGTSARK